MIKINTTYGDTYKFDLENSEQAKKLIELLDDEEFQSIITGITLLQNYKRKHRCTNRNCKCVSKLVCPRCGEIKNDNVFNYINQYSLKRPNCKKVNFQITKENKIVNGIRNGRVRLLCSTEDIQLSITTYHPQPASRIILTALDRDI